MRTLTPMVQSTLPHSYCVSNAGQTREVRGGRVVARYYVLHGSFLQDLLSTAVWLTQVRLQMCYMCPLGAGSLRLRIWGEAARGGGRGWQCAAEPASCGTRLGALVCAGRFCPVG